MLAKHARNGQFAYYRVEAEVDTSFTETVIPSAEVHLLLVDARRARVKAETWPEEVAEALREDPGLPWALSASTRPGGRPSGDRLRDAVERRPADWRGWYLLYRARVGEARAAFAATEELQAPLRAALAANPDLAVAHNELAWNLATLGRPREALQHANRAVDLAPWNGHYVDTLAFVAAALDKCPEALVLQERAVELARDESGSMRARLRAYEARCGTSPADPW